MQKFNKSKSKNHRRIKEQTLRESYLFQENSILNSFLIKLKLNLITNFYGNLFLKTL